MKLYSLSSKLDFGEYKGKTLQEVFMQDPDFIEESILENPTFCFNPGSIEALEDMHPEFSFSDEAVEKLEEKYDIYEDEENHYEEDENFSEDDLKNLGIMDDYEDDYEDMSDGGGFYDDNY
jgi:hypothetical protein